MISQFNIAYPLTHPGAGTIETTRSRTGPGTVYAPFNNRAPGSEETIETATMDAGPFRIVGHGSTDGSSTLKSFKREVGGPYYSRRQPNQFQLLVLPKPPPPTILWAIALSLDG